MQPPSKSDDDADDNSEKREAAKEMLSSLRSAFTLKGRMEQIEGRARLTKDSSLLSSSSEEYLGLKEEFEGVDFEVRKILLSVSKQRVQQQRGQKSSNNTNNKRNNDNNNRGNNNQ